MQEKRGRKMFSRGIWVLAEVVERVKAEWNPAWLACFSAGLGVFTLLLADFRSCRPYEKFARCASNARAGAAQILTRSVLAYGSAPPAASGLSLAFLASSPGKTLSTAKELKIDSTTTREEC